MGQRVDFLQNMNMRQFLLSVLRGLGPSLFLSVLCTVIVYALLSPHFPSSSLLPLLAASCCPIFGNAVSLIRSHHVDIFGILVLVGIVVSIVGVLLGGGSQLLLIRESFVTGALGLAFLVSSLFPKSLGYYFAKQFLTGNDPDKSSGFKALWQYPSFRRGIQGGTLFWGVLLLLEFIIRVVLVLVLPILLVLTVAPIVFNILIVVGIIVSAIWVRSIIRHINKKGRWNTSRHEQ